jgi:hypothetical protein
MPLRRRPACASTPCSPPTPPGGVSSGLDMRSFRLAPSGTLRLRREHSAPECQSGARSALAVSHDFDGFLRTRGAGLLHPAADHGVRLVAGTLRRRADRAVLLDRGPTTKHRPTSPPESPPSLEVREVDSPPPRRWSWSVSRRSGRGRVVARQPRGVRRRFRVSPSGRRRGVSRPEGLPLNTSRTPPAEARGPPRPTFGDRSAEAMLHEAGAVCRSHRSPAPFSQARSPFGAFPSSTAVPRHRGLLPSRRCAQRCRSPGPRPEPNPRFPSPLSAVLKAFLRDRVRCPRAV